MNQEIIDSAQIANSDTTIPNHPPSPIEKSKKSFPWLVLLLFITFTSVSVYLFWQNQQLRSQLTAATSSPSPNPSASVALTQDSTAGWQTYTATDKKYTFRYPSDWKIQEKNGKVLIFPTGYREGTFFTLEPINSNFDFFLQKKSLETNCELKSGETKVAQNSNLQVASAYNECNGQIYGFYYINGSPNILISHHVNDSGYLESVGAILTTFKFTN